jgi:hypothetical protein
MVDGAENFIYQMWLVDWTNTWVERFGTLGPGGTMLEISEGDSRESGNYGPPEMRRWRWSSCSRPRERI